MGQIPAAAERAFREITTGEYSLSRLGVGAAFLKPAYPGKQAVARARGTNRFFSGHGRAFQVVGRNHYAELFRTCI